jgi:hypothetical protein
VRNQDKGQRQRQRQRVIDERSFSANSMSRVQSSKFQGLAEIFKKGTGSRMDRVTNTLSHDFKVSTGALGID